MVELAVAANHEALDTVNDVVDSDIGPRYDDLVTRAVTGRTMADWVELAQRSGLKDGHEQQSWLRTEHHLDSTTAFTIARRAAAR